MRYKGKGLNREEVLKSRELHGTNALKKEKTKSAVRRFFENLNDPIIKVLLLALLVEVIFTFGNCNLFEVFGIAAAILIATTVSTASELGSERAFQKMQGEGKGTVRAVRDGELCEISADEVVVGDVLMLTRGEKIHADGVMLSGDLKVDQSALNGESTEASKRVSGNSFVNDLSFDGALFRGSVITEGEGFMRVSAVGAETYYGMVAKDVQAQTRESPLKVRLSEFAKQISKLGYFMAIVVALTYLFNSFVSDNGFVLSKILASLKDVPFLISTLTHALTLMITVIVVAAPEGLPMMITVVLSANMKRMIKDGVLVKKPVGIETAGSMNILFTDKTGTLTTGKLECERIITANNSYKSAASLKKDKALFEMIKNNALLNNAAVITEGKILGGNGTDRALASIFISERADMSLIKEQLPFSSEKKISSVTLKGGMTLYKGAPEVILSNSKYALSGNGELKSPDIQNLKSEYESAAKAGNRVIAMSYSTEECVGHIFLCLVVFKDKIRLGVKNAVREVKRAGVQVVMLTGDGKETAQAIASECGIIDTLDGLVITSRELSEMSDDYVKSILPRLRVLARALPRDKSRLVKLSQELGLVVGMTGDGINDAPSLKLCDVGFSMGSGEDIAKSAGDIVLADDSFISISKTILYGRTIFKSIRKFITFQLIMNITACGVSLVGQFLGIDSPITIIQMLWVNIIMDTLGGLAFAGEPPLGLYMKEKPKKREEAILSKEMIHQIIFDGAYTLFICILFLRSAFIRANFSSVEGLMSGFYALFIFAGIFNCFGARSERMWMLANIGKNRPFVLIMLLISAIQIAMIYYGGTLFRTIPLSVRELSLVILIAASVVVFEMIRRMFYKLRR